MESLHKICVPQTRGKDSSSPPELSVGGYREKYTEAGTEIRAVDAIGLLFEGAVTLKDVL